MRGAGIAAFLALIVAGASVNGASPPPPPADILPGSRTAFGKREIIYAWLVKPTDRYNHGALGDRIEAAGLRVMFRGGGLAEAALPEGQVFEDLEPRIVDVDGDGRDEVMVVRTSADQGASLAVFGEKTSADGKRGLTLLAETPPIGAPMRWLNPIGVADLDGDGKPEVALIRTPHLGGVLEIHRMSEGRLAKLAELAGYSNHVFGSRVLRMSALADMDGDGVADIVVPTQDRMAVAVVSFAGGKLRETRRVALPAAAVGEFSVISPTTTGAPKGTRPEVWIGLADGEKFILQALP